MSQQLIDNLGNEWRLGEEIGSGGEGAVFNLANASNYVAKIYRRPVDDEKRQKILCMTQCFSQSLAQFAAWPRALLVRRGSPVGVVMPKFTGVEEIHCLYGPQHRKATFPKAGWRFLVRAARNCAIAFEQVHQNACVIGDVNEGNILVAHDATVRLIDCDSFQVHSNGRVFPCRVGVLHYTSPELHGMPYDQTARTREHDYFGLAILIFQLLMMGRHPFAGRFSGRHDMPIERAIAERRFAYGTQAKTKGMQPPPNTLPCRYLGGAMSLFERAFLTSDERPNTREWETCLKSIESRLVTCKNEKAHQYWPASPECPWCEIARRGGPVFFVSTSITTFTYKDAVGRFSIERYSRAVAACKRPARPEPVPGQELIGAATGQSFPQDVQKPLDRKAWIVATSVASVVFMVAATYHGLFLIGTIVSGVITAVLVTNARGTLAYRDEVARRKGIRQSSENLWRQFAAEWRTYFDRSNRLFDRLKKEIGELSEQILELEKNLQAAIAKARRQADEKQKEAFLGRFYISHARIEGIGEGRLAALESFGIESAADVSAGAVRRAPGIGPVLARRIVAWRRSVESKFKFDPNKSISTDESLKIHRKFSQRRVAIVNDLDRGLKRLQALSNEAEQRRKHLERAGERIAKAYAQALADCEV
jgi:DNA-binding helix-hairpin-helix protein with protein kinase domain